MSKSQAIKNFVGEGIARRTAQRYVNRQLMGNQMPGNAGNGITQITKKIARKTSVLPEKKSTREISGLDSYF